MKAIIRNTLLVAGLVVGIHFSGLAQGSDIYGKGIRLNINEDGSKYIRFITWHQLWTRYVQNNPGTTVNGEAQSETFDIGMRRSRFLWYAQISSRFMVLMHVGINNQTFINGGASGGTPTPGGYGPGKKPQLFIHDAWTEYTVVKDKLYIGTGLHYWNGVSRLASASTLNFMAMDAPIFNWPLIEESDQFARQFGIYAKGKLGKLDYRVALNKPFATPTPVVAGNPAVPVDRAIATENNNWAFAGYLTYDIFDKESNVLPFFVGTYIGTKKVWNIGAGWHYHPGATASVPNATTPFQERTKHDMLLFGVDSFLDLPLEPDGNTAITAYASYLNYNFGPNYVRSVGIMNEGGNTLTGVGPIGGTLPQGPGNTQYLIGTGSIFYAEAGYLLPKDMLGDKGKVQVFGTLTHKNLEFTGEPSLNYAAGFNYFVDGHHAKISLKYQTRALYAAPLPGEKPKLNPDQKSAGELILQTMIYL